MLRLYDRLVQVKIGTEEFNSETIKNAVRSPGFRMTFDIQQSIRKRANTAEVKIYNLSSLRLGKIDRQNQTLVISVGYRDEVAVTGLGLLFKGTTNRVFFEKTPEGVVCTAGAGDGDALHNKPITFSLAPGATVKQQIESVLADVKANARKALEEVRKGNIKLGFDKLFNGLSVSSTVGNEMDKLSRTHGFEWFTLNDEIVILGRTATTMRTELSPEKGLIGSPVRMIEDAKGKIQDTKKGVSAKAPLVLRARSLIRSNLTPGAQVDLTSSVHSGRFKVLQVTHRGDTHSDDWYSEVDMVAL